MRAFALPPCDPRVGQMNEAQWLWSYMNLKKDQDEEEKNWKARLTYLGSYTDFERAKSIAEQDAMEEQNERSGRKHVIDGVYRNTEFELESKAASLGYDPNSDLTPGEFLQKYYENNGKDNFDINNASFDDLIASGEFNVVTDGDGTVGNKNESQDDFLSRVAQFESISEKDLDIMTKPPIGIESDDELNALTNGNIDLINNLLNDDIDIMRSSIKQDRQPLYKSNNNKIEIDEDDLDIIITTEKDGGDDK